MICYIVGKTKYVPLLPPNAWKDPWAILRDVHGKVVLLSKSKGKRKENKQ